jgi:hypothetical protein
VKVVRKDIRDKAIELLEHFERVDLENIGSRDSIDCIVEMLRDGCVGWVDRSDQNILDLLSHHIRSDEDLDSEDEETLEYHAELREVISQMQADMAVAAIIGGKIETQQEG